MAGKRLPLMLAKANKSLLFRSFAVSMSFHHQQDIVTALASPCSACRLPNADLPVGAETSPPSRTISQWRGKEVTCSARWCSAHSCRDAPALPSALRAGRSSSGPSTVTEFARQGVQHRGKTTRESGEDSSEWMMVPCGWCKDPTPPPPPLISALHRKSKPTFL